VGSVFFIGAVTCLDCVASVGFSKGTEYVEVILARKIKVKLK
jgi:hypothetical protein